MPPYPSIEYSEEMAGTYILRKMFVKKYEHSIHGFSPPPPLENCEKRPQ